MPVDTAPKLKKKSNLGFLIETTTGTPNIPAAAQGVTNVFNANMEYDTEIVAREPQGNLSQIQQATGAARGGRVTFETELVGSGVSGGGSPSWMPLFQACGCLLTGAVLTPQTSNMTTLTIAHWIDSTRRLLSGCMGNAKILMKRGQKARIQWEFHGVAQPVIDQTNILPTYVTSPVAPRAGASYTIGGQSARVSDITFDLGNQVIMREDQGGVDSASQPTGYRSAMIVGRRPTFAFSPETFPIATFDAQATFNALTQLAFTLTIGSTSGNTFVLAAPSLQIVQPPKDGDRNGLYTTDLTLLAERLSALGEDEWTLTLS